MSGNPYRHIATPFGPQLLAAELYKRIHTREWNGVESDRNAGVVR